MQTSWLYLLQKWSYGRSKFYIAGIGIFDLIASYDLELDLMTFIYESDPYCREIPEACKYELLASKLSKVIV